MRFWRGKYFLANGSDYTSDTRFQSIQNLVPTKIAGEYRGDTREFLDAEVHADFIALQAMVRAMAGEMGITPLPGEALLLFIKRVTLAVTDKALENLPPDYDPAESSQDVQKVVAPNPSGAPSSASKQIASSQKSSLPKKPQKSSGKKKKSPKKKQWNNDFTSKNTTPRKKKAAASSQKIQQGEAAIPAKPKKSPKKKPYNKNRRHKKKSSQGNESSGGVWRKD